MRRAAFFLILIASAAPGPPARAAAHSPEASRNLGCVPTPEVKQALATVPRRDPACEPTDDCWVDKIRKAEALLDRYPFDLHVHRRYQDLVTARTNDLSDPLTQAAAERYRRFAADHPNDALPHYLLARFTDDRAEAEKALALSPTFPWPHALLATLLRGQDPQPTPESSAAAGAEFETFTHLCPDRFEEVLKRDLTVGDPALWQRLLPQARAALLKGPPTDQVAWIQTLWDREFDAWPPAEHELVRARVRADLARIESWKRRADEPWWKTLQQGYKMLDDPRELERVEAGYAKRFPCSWLGVERTIDPFIASRGGSEHLHDQTQAQWRDAYEKTGRWIETCPDQYRYLSYHFEAAERRGDIDNRALTAEADRYLTAWDRIAADWTAFPSPYAEVAAAFLSRGIDPPRALGFARKAADEYAANRARRAAWQTDAQKRDSEGWDRIVDFGAFTLIAEAALAAGRRDECDAALARADALYHRFTDAHRELLGAATGSHSRYWRVRARVAEAERRSPDALAYWRLAVQHADSNTSRRTTESDRASLDRLWRDLGGTPEGLATWMMPSGPAGGGAAAATLASVGPAAPEAKSDALPWDSPGDALPPFSLTDLDGRTWKLADLTGKTLFINVWATWCGPCRAEIPHLRDLNDRLRERRDVVLLSFNTDDSAGVVAPFARANRMTWPVLFASAYFESLGGAMSVPQNWVVDGAGVRRAMQLGFDAAHPDAWLDSALGVIDKASTSHP